ncbi:MAG: SDR family oxidoreductase [Planctomycetaceae bacterium]|jgi:nucleoside-diphosphate-sugar epimerase|nr:SDR family oxidoreductase [Planctomycetaceae bacterium]
MSKLIIGCGYLGLRVAHQWRENGDEVYALTRSVETAEQFRQLGIHPIIGDVMQPETLTFPAGISTCLYAIGLDRSAGFSQREVYVEGLKNVLTAETFQPQRLIYISSTSVYGQSDGGVINEESPTEPARDNGTVCLDAEALVREQMKTPWNILRLSGIYGPGRLLARKEKLAAREPMRGNPDGYLNLIHVDDAVKAVLKCEANPDAVNELFLISDNRPVLRREYYTLLAEQFGTPEPVFEDADADNLAKQCDNSKARELLDFALKYPSITEGVPASV